MKKKLLILFGIVLLSSCGVNKTIKKNFRQEDASPPKFNQMLVTKKELNKSVIDGFFEGDSVKIHSRTYFIK